MPWIDACATTDIEAEAMIRFDYSGKTYAIYRSPDDEYFCTDGMCTHENDEGMLFCRPWMNYSSFISIK